jgi:WD40 repeat protein
MRLLITAILLATLTLAPRALAAGAPTAPTWSQVRAILANRCMSCHDAKEAESELVMETYASLMKGGENGRDIIPGSADESPLIRQLEHRAKPYMPPPKKAAALPAEEIALIRAWINAGAPGPKAGEIISSATPTTRPVAKNTPKVAVRRPILSLAYEPKMAVAAAARPGEVEIWSVAQQEIVHRFQKLAGDVNAVAFSADGTRLFAGGGDPGVTGRVWVWSVPDWKLVRMFEGHTDAIYSLAVSPDGKTLATGSYDQKIVLWDLSRSGEPSRTSASDETPARLAGPTRADATQDGHGQDAHATARRATLIGHNGAVFGVAFRPDGRVLASVSADRTLKLWDVQTGKRLDTRPEPVKDLYGLAWSPDGSRVAAGGVDNRIRVWKVSPSAVEGTNSLEFAKFAHDGTVLRVAWSPDGKWILSSADNNTLRLFSADDMRQKLTFAVQSDWPSALTFTEGGKSAVVGRLDGSISFYDALTGREIPAPKPVLTSASPRGIERGHVARVKLTGKSLSRVTGVTLTAMAAHGVTAKLLPDPKPTSAWIEVTSAADAPLEAVSLMVTGPGGPSLPIKLYVDDLPQIEEAATTGTLPQALPAPASVWGAFMPAGDVDHFAIDAKKEQTLVLDVAAKRLGSKSQVTLTILDAAGHVVASAGAVGDDPDPLLTFTAPADGRYVIKVADLTAGGTVDNFYRLSIGSFAYVTATFPLAIPANAESKVQLIGHNLPANAWVNVKAAAEGEVGVPVDAAKFRSRRPLKVFVSKTPELLEIKPNGMPAMAMHIPAAASVNGRIASPGQASLFRFDAKAGVNYVVETMAAQRGSPVDTRIQILYPDGRPVPRLLLRAVRDCDITFRGIDANEGGARFPNYQELDLNQFVYMNGEVVRLFRYPEGPDSVCFFYTLNGKRRCYFDTTPTAHAVDQKCYIVEPHAPGEKLLPNGLPVIPIWYENDDDSDRFLGADSRLTFTPPADGSYLVRVTDTRNFGGSDYVYRLTVRPARPDFTATIEGYDPNPPAGVGREFTVKLNRMDGFDGPVKVEISPPPAGFTISSPIVVEAGQWEAKGTIYAAPDAPAAMPPASAGALKVAASAMVDGRAVSLVLPDLKRPWAGMPSQVYVTLEPAASVAGAAAPGSAPQPIVVTPGKLTPVWLRAHRNGYTKALSFDYRNFPHGVYVADIGLNGVQLLEGQNERQIFIECAPWVAGVDRPGFMRVREIGNPTTPPTIVRVLGNPAEKGGR